MPKFGEMPAVAPGEEITKMSAMMEEGGLQNKAEAEDKIDVQIPGGGIARMPRKEFMKFLEDHRDGLEN